MRYGDVFPGQWVQPKRKGYKMACCDCGLVHVVNIRVKDGHVQWQMFRHNRATGQVRRWLRKRRQGVFAA